MSYSESKDGQVILTMSREDYNFLLFALGCATGEKIKQGEKIDGMLNFMNRLNQGNPHYTPYQVEEKSSTSRSGERVDQSLAESTRKAVKPL